MNTFTINQNSFLSQKIKAFYHDSYQNIKSKDYLNDLKNTYGKPTSSDADHYRESELVKLDKAMNKLEQVLEHDLPILLSTQLTICVVPRAKAESSYNEYQLLFKKTVKKVVNTLNCEDGTDYIIRQNNTKTTHLPANTPNYNNDGSEPYKGITKDSCNISSDVEGKDILLIDDIYTDGVNIDEDAIQSLLDNGANSVIFYAVAKA